MICPKIFLSIFTAAFLVPSAFAQDFSVLERSDNIPVAQDGILLANPWMGGLNSPQISKVDLNGDGVEDLFIYDRDSDSSKVVPFLNNAPGPGEMNWKHAYQYVEDFPPLEKWALMRDYDGDGKKDIFTATGNSKVAVYKNTSSGSNLSFQLQKDPLFATYDYGVPFDAPAYVLGLDIPAIHDHDMDGDMDIITFGDNGSTLYYYQNQSQELYGHADSLIYELVNSCTGYIAEASENNAITLGFECSSNVVDPELSIFSDEEKDRGNRHAGGMVLGLDTNADGIFDFALSDVTYPDVTLLINDESSLGLDTIVEQVFQFPSDLDKTFPIDIYIFPGVYYEDVDNDGTKDILSAANARFNAEDTEIWYYKNNGADNLPDLTLEKTRFLTEDIIDVGNHAHPVFFDHDGDGDLDMVVSNRNDFIGGLLDSYSNLTFYENVANNGPENFSFEYVTGDYAEILALNLTSAQPCFGDIDGDGDPDMILGESSGLLHFFENTAGPGSPAVWEIGELSIPDSQGSTIDVGQFAVPQLVDLNEDGLLDLSVGHKNGSIRYFENVGDENSFAFELKNEDLGNVLAEQLLGINGYSVPHFFKTEEGWQLLLGSETGQLNWYDNIEDNLEVGTSFDLSLNNPAVASIWEGNRAAPSVAFTGEEKMMLFVGLAGGGVVHYDYSVLSTTEFSLPEFDLHVFPNPNGGELSVRWENCQCQTQRLQVVDMSGRLVMSRHIGTEGNLQSLDLSQLANGSYMLQLITEKGNATERFVLMR